MSREYRKPPIKEAICEFQIAPDIPWDLTTPGLLYEKIQGMFPRKQDQTGRETEVALNDPATSPKARDPRRIVFISADEQALVEVGERLVAIHCLAPYPRWERFNEQIQAVLEPLISITRATAFQTISLRYLNQITIPSQTIELGEYFEFRPSLGSRLPQPTVAFFVGSMMLVNDEKDKCKVQLATDLDNSTEEEAAFILDISIAPCTGPVKVEESNAWIDQAHRQVEEIFEGCITDNLRTLFDREDPLDESD